MFSLSRLSIAVRLGAGFLTVVLFILAFGITSLIQMDQLAELTEKMYNHPMVVSNAVRDIKIQLLSIQGNLQRLIYQENGGEMLDQIASTHSMQRAIEEYFRLIEENFLGNMEDVEKAHTSFSSLSPLIDEILTLVQQGEMDLAEEKNLTMDRLYMSPLHQEIQVMSRFARGKSDEFFNESMKKGRSALRITIVFLIFISTLSLIVAWAISQSVIRPLKALISHVEALSIGDQHRDIPLISTDEIGQLSRSLKTMQNNLRQVTSQSVAIAQGDYTGELPLRSEKDDLARSINDMTKALNLLKEKNDYSDWLKTGQNQLNQQMRGDLTLEDLSSRIIGCLAEYLQCPSGAFFIFDPKDQNLKMTGSYAYHDRKELSQTFSLGQGLLGQAALEKKSISISRLPQDYLNIRSGLGQGEPSYVLAVPFLVNGDLKGVLELAGLGEIPPSHGEFLDLVKENIAVSVQSCQSRFETQSLLTQQQVQAKEMQAQQEELRAANEELEEKTESLSRSQERLKYQQEELQATNEELEEKTESLELQRDEINIKNQELEQVKEEILRKAQDLENSSRYKSEFLANMSHELRTPLNSLLILAKDLLDNKGNRLNDEDVKSAEIIYNSGNELLQLINEILDLSKIESGKMDLDLHDVKLEELSLTLEKLFEKTAEDRGVALKMELLSGIPVAIRTDRQKLGQVLKNLLSNALKFTSEGEVSLTIGPKGEDLPTGGEYPAGAVAFSVSDTGIGISQEQQEHIFEAFKQADGSTSREYGGTGLGLSISREIAQLLGGEILLKSQRGTGSVFTLVLPLELERRHSFQDSSLESFAESMAPPPPALQDRAPGESTVFLQDDRDSLTASDRVILVVEDDRNFASILAMQARSQGFKVLLSPRGEEALELAREFMPQAVLLDIKLPGMDGLQVLDKLKRHQNTRHIPVHIISGDERSMDVLDKGVVGFLKKPISRDQLQTLFGDLSLMIEKKVKDLLIVEDDQKLRYAIEKLIGDVNVQKTSVGSGGDALKELASRKFDCMVLDLSLPDMSGKEVLESLASMEVDPKPPVIIYTGKEISYEEEFELRRYASSIIIKGVHSQERLLDETALFLHRVIKDLPREQQKMISKVHDEEAIFKGKEILLVDDDMRNVFALTKILEDWGMVVKRAVNGQKALDYLDESPEQPDLILMDIMMPVMDGYEAMRRIRSNPVMESIPILALTAKAMKEDRHRCLEAGANDYMTKPIDGERLLSLMRVWLYK